MDNEQTAKLWKECQDAKRAALRGGLSDDEAHSAAAAKWNAWADSLVQERKHLEENGLWQTEIDQKGDLRGANDATTAWLSSAEVDFSFVEFQLSSIGKTTASHAPYTLPPGVAVKATLKAEGRAIDFRNFRFPGKAEFSLTVFSAWAWFEGASFDGPALFAGARLLNWIGFERVLFGCRADFHQADFDDHAVFTDATFEMHARFDLATFHQLADLRGVEFRGEALFFAITCERGLLFGKPTAGGESLTTFRHLPNFIQASFSEAPVLDETNLRSPEFIRNVRSAQSPEQAMRYRALRRLALESHSYSQEIDFLAEELRAGRKRSDHRRWMILSVLYEQVSDFGRSLTRPVRLMALFFLLFSLLYSFVFQLAGGEECSEFADGVYLASLSALPWSGVVVDRSQALAQLCLGGAVTPAKHLLDVLIGAQVAISIALWFLFLLAVRNRFRIG